MLMAFMGFPRLPEWEVEQYVIAIPVRVQEYRLLADLADSRAVQSLVSALHLPEGIQCHNPSATDRYGGGVPFCLMAMPFNSPTTKMAGALRSRRQILVRRGIG